MKYLNRRDEFIKNIKDLNIKQINEAFDMSGDRGPFGNDIPWGDSLVGRLFNAISRKIGIGINLVRIQPVISRLKLEFDKILAYAESEGLLVDDRKKISMVLICSQIRIIKLAIVNMQKTDPEDIESTIEIKKDEYLDEVESITKSVIIEIDDISKKFGKIENQDELVKVLEELLGVIKIMKDELKSENKEVSKESSKTSNIENEISNFKSVANIVLQYQLMKDAKKSDFQSKEVSQTTDTQSNVSSTKAPSGHVSTSTSKQGQYTSTTSGSMPKYTSTSSDKTEDDKPAGKPKLGSSNLEKTKKEEEVDKKDESYVFENAKSILVPIKKLYDTLKQMNVDIIKDFQNFVKMDINSEHSFAPQISKIYKNVRLKAGVNEHLDQILSNDKAIADAIYTLYLSSKVKRDGSFEGISDGMKSAISEFNRTMSKCLSSTKIIKDSKVVLNYGDFIKESKLSEFLGWSNDKIAKLFGKDENKNVDNLKITEDNKQTVLSAYWTEIYESKISKILVTDKQYLILRKEVDKLTVDDQDNLIIGSMDPVIEILKCFNRAYKIHTTDTIPGGRSEGKISRGVRNEYDCFGGGSNAMDGPWRNKKIFNSWESAVLDIMKDRKYQKIFSKNTSLRVGNEIKKGAGLILHKLMNELLNGDKLYKSSSKDGAQKEFLEKYFGSDSVEGVKSSQFFIGGEGEKEKIETISDSIKTTNLTFKDKSEIKDINKLKRMIVKIECDMTKSPEYKKGENPELDAKNRYFLALEMDNENFYVVFSRRFGYISKYIENDLKSEGSSVSFDPASLKNEPLTDIYLTKMKRQSFINMLKAGNVIDINGQVLGTTDKKSIGKQKTIKVEYLYEVKEGSEPEIYNMEKYNFEGTKGFKIDELKSGHAPESK